MATCRTRITVHGVPMDIFEDKMEAFFLKFSKVEEVKALLGKSSIETGDVDLQVTLTQRSFGEIPNILLCRERRILVAVEGWRPCCWSCRASGHMAKERSACNLAHNSSSSSHSTHRGGSSGERPLMMPGRRLEVVGGRKTCPLPAKRMRLC